MLVQIRTSDNEMESEPKWLTAEIVVGTHSVRKVEHQNESEIISIMTFIIGVDGRFSCDVRDVKI